MARDTVTRLVAEQVAVDCGAVDAEAVLAGLGPAAGPAGARLLAVLRLAGDRGDAAGLLLLGDATPPAPERSHELITSPVAHQAGEWRLHFEWRTHAYDVLFETLRGRLAARPGPPGMVLGIEGTYVVAPNLVARPLGIAAARRATETAVRAWLGQLRSALEHRPVGAAAPLESGHAPIGAGGEPSPP